MTAPTWPISLPQNMTIQSYAEGGKDNVIRSETDIGPAKTRRRATNAIRPISGTFFMTDEQLSRFEDFMADTVADGALAFYFPAQGRSSGTWLVRQTEAYQAIYNGGRWEVSVKLEILP